MPAVIEKPRRRRGRGNKPPIEVPPPDAKEVDQTAIDAVLADLGWRRRKASAGEILAVVGDGEVGRAISYRQSQFVYESVVDSDFRSTVCTFSTAWAARRFMIMELSAILRMRRRLGRSST